MLGIAYAQSCVPADSGSLPRLLVSARAQRRASYDGSSSRGKNQQLLRKTTLLQLGTSAPFTIPRLGSGPAITQYSSCRHRQPYVSQSLLCYC